LCAVVAVFLTVWAARARAADLTRYDSKYYIVYTDVDPETAREAVLRMTHMADEYHDRTRSFAGTLRAKFPFYLYRSPDDYYAAGGSRGSAGVFIGSSDGSGKLMAIAGQRITPYTWHTVQHEGFHQFAHAVIGGHIPTWLNEGLAEYFGEGLFTGDGFVTGVVPPWRLSRLKAEISGGRLMPIRGIMAVTPQEWSAQLTIENYDQVWSMVHFLVHADGGKYADPFAACIRQVSAGKPFDVAWASTIGSTDGFDQRWKDYWLGQPASPTHDLYERATVATLTSFLARATAQRQSFADFAAFTAAADEGTVKVAPDDWLPRSMLTAAVKAARADGGDGPAPDDGGDAAPAAPRWALAAGVDRQPTVTLADADGTRLTGWFTLGGGGRVSAVNVEVDDTAKVLAAAAVLRDAGKKEQARTMVQAAIQRHPRTPLLKDAAAFLRSCR
jgi:hypothetical protein